MRSLVVFLTVLSLVGFLLLLWTLVEYLDWSSGISSTAPRLTFNAFEKLYALNSSKWKFFSNYVVYYPNGGTDNETMVIEFLHFHDVVRYKFFRDRLEANKEELERIAEQILKASFCKKEYGDFPISFAYGIGTRSEGDTISDVFMKADQLMYENKSASKAMLKRRKDD